MLWKTYKDSRSAQACGRSSDDERPSKKLRVAGLTESRSAFLKSQLEAADKHEQESLSDEYEQWKRVPAIAEDDPKSYNPLLYWQLQSQQYPTLSKFAINILTILASAADCERTFSELGDMLGTRRLRMKVELITALQCLKSWHQIGLKTLKPGHTTDKLATIQAYLSNFESFF